MGSNAAFKSAVHLFLMKDDTVLLSRRRNTGYEDGKYSVPAGHLDGGEEVKAAALREAAEEIGIRLAEADLEIAGVMHRQSDDEHIDFFLVVRTWSGEISNQEPEKCEDLAWFAMDRLPANIVPYVARALQNAQDGRWFESFGWGDDSGGAS